MHVTIDKCIKVDSEVEGIESIVPYAPSLVKKAKRLCFYTKDIANFEKKIFE